jgi:cytidine deaminase
MVLEALTEKENIMEFPRYERSEEDPRFAIKDMSTGVPTPAGLGLMPDPSLMANLADLRVRGRDHAKLDGENETAPWTASPRDKDKAPSKFPINFIFFPLLATLLPSWKAQIEERQYPRNVRRVLILVTGVGTPRNWTHSVSGNSTEVCATLMERFLQRVDPDLTVVKIHSDTNIFRYDDNLRFVDKEFAPVMNAWRDAHAKGMPYPGERIMAGANANPFNADWRNSMSVTLSSADGSSARTHAIRESLRPFRPTFFHFWQLKTFWHEFKIVDNDIEVHSYETMETSPAVDAERLRDPHAQMVVNEMKAFREEMIETLRRGQHDISKFWLRKTHKPVLAVLLVQSHGSTKPVLYRGTNMEVSMPTGSLCAERNVIGSALAANPELKREDLKLIAVLAIPTLEDLTAEPTLKRVASAASVGSIPSSSGERRNSVGSEVEQPGDWILSTDQQQPTGLDQSFAMVADETKEDNESTPVRKIRLFSKSARHQNRRSVVVQNSRDLNPLAPCGACNEWLKKISESNPYFTILTFTDAECHGVYCTPCQQ